MLYKEVVPVVQDLKSRRRLVRIEKHPHVYDGVITEVSEDTGTLELRVASGPEGNKTLVFEFAGADFQEWRTRPAKTEAKVLLCFCTPATG